MRPRLTALAVSTACLTLGLGVAAAPAHAVPADKPQVLSQWTQTDAGSYNAWVSANGNQGAWSAYQFNWSTDYCSSSPDNPLGFPFKTACARHDFGYRNYKEAGTFNANKARIDSAFYEDLKRVCARYTGATKTTCNGTAWTYYQAVDKLGFSGVVGDRTTA
ncbi:phospholipase [Streptomyces durmitorensis]|uniref:Phospholipase n=1 Tax=Streptomyces durmitorensis TaxID=319947 RepID=A0ABY4PKU7_9ACTN|nr:phospholipase [Streptomyces durmitorensis]UQT53688.1 phospholipase [Streptomyces durmitorensis]